MFTTILFSNSFRIKRKWVCLCSFISSGVSVSLWVLWLIWLSARFNPNKGLRTKYLTIGAKCLHCCHIKYRYIQFPIKCFVFVSVVAPSVFIYCFGFWILLGCFLYTVLTLDYNSLQRRECDLVTKNNHVLFSICLLSKKYLGILGYAQYIIIHFGCLSGWFLVSLKSSLLTRQDAASKAKQ